MKMDSKSLDIFGKKDVKTELMKSSMRMDNLVVRANGKMGKRKVYGSFLMKKETWKNLKHGKMVCWFNERKI